MTPAGTAGCAHETKIVPANPLTDVRVKGKVAVPLKGMVTLLPVMVKLGAGAGAGDRAAQRLGVSARRAAKQVSTPFLLITEPSGYPCNCPLVEWYAVMKTLCQTQRHRISSRREGV